MRPSGGGLLAATLMDIRQMRVQAPALGSLSSQKTPGGNTSRRALLFSFRSV